VRHNREIINAARRENYARNREKEQNRLKKWRADHPDLVREQNRRRKAATNAKYPEKREAIQARIRKFRADHPEKVREYNQRAYRKHRQKILMRAKRYAKENPHVVAGTQAKIRAIKMGAALGDLVVIGQWQKAIRAMKWVRCHWCGTKVTGRKVQFDHVVALAKGGAHSIANLCVSCRECNQRKNARVIADWVVDGQAFLAL